MQTEHHSCLFAKCPDVPKADSRPDFPWLDASYRLPTVIVAGITEYLDGAISRRHNVTSKFGRLLDPIADKVFVVAVLATLVSLGDLTIAELAFIAARDIAVVAVILWLVATGERERVLSMRPAMPGKVATALQFALILTLVAKVSVPFLISITGVVSVVAAVDYFRRFRDGVSTAPS